ncbi:MAG TPA: proline racemase family protein [Ktedonobacterales bacterium]|jgi:trans-L-3-hydroxyproline dehydratase
MTITWRAPETPADAIVITTIDAHAAGEPLRIITGGLPELPGATILERRRYLREHLDHVRRALMWEPRGHADMYGCVVTPPVSPEADVGVVFLHNAGYSTMCGHGVIALVTALVETGTLPARGPETPVGLDTPAGLVRATAHLDAQDHVTRVTFLNVPSFVLARDVMVDGPNGERVAVDVAFGGAFYAVAPAAAVGLRVAPERTAALVHAGEAIKAGVNAALAIQHPDEPDLGFLYGTILTDEPEDPAHHSRNMCVFADAEVDRSPTGTGVSARLAMLHARGQVAEGDAPIAIESVLGASSVFTGRVVGTTTVGPYHAVVPEVGGTAHITGRHQFILDPADPLGHGFLVR